jgi:hypothetical protein
LGERPAQSEVRAGRSGERIERDLARSLTPTLLRSAACAGSGLVSASSRWCSNDPELATSLRIEERRARGGRAELAAHLNGEGPSERAFSFSSVQPLEDAFRDERRRVLATLIGFLGDFDLAEEAAEIAVA